MNNKNNKLLIITQKVDQNDSNLGFFHGWVLEFAKHCEELIIICLEKGEHDLPTNVKVLSLGKEENVSKFIYLTRFYKYIWQNRKNYDNVFVHMNVEYVILGGLVWKMLKKKIGLWYMHKSVTSKLKLAEKLTNVIFTGSKESFRLKSKKLKVLHHGIDSDLFFKKDKEYNQDLRLLTVGRISKVKNIDLMIDLVSELKKNIDYVNLQIIGESITKDDIEYLDYLKSKILDKNLVNDVELLGAMPMDKLPHFYQEADICLNFSQTGSIDKVILEAMSCGTPVLTTNESMHFLSEQFFYKNNDVSILQDKVLDIYNLGTVEKEQAAEALHKMVASNHSLTSLIKQILKNYGETSR